MQRALFEQYFFLYTQNYIKAIRRYRGRTSKAEHKKKCLIEDSKEVQRKTVIKFTMPLQPCEDSKYRLTLL